MCCNEYKDNRESCVNIIPSSCVPYTGYISDSIKDDFKCKPNINDLFKKLQELIDEIKESLGDNSKISLDCFSEELDEGFTQEDFNRVTKEKICLLEKAIENNTLDPDSIRLAVNLLCLQDPSCEPKTHYSIRELFTKLIAAYCSLQERVAVIENILNI